MKKLFGKFEFIFLMLFFFCIIAWAVSQCQAKSKELLAQEDGVVLDEEPIDTPAEIVVDTPASMRTPKNTPPSTPKPNKPAISTTNAPILYVTLDGLKIRKAPNIKGEVVATMNLHDKVYFLEQQSEHRDTFRLETGESVGEPWLKVSTNGREGWAWGAGLHFYKKDRLKNN